MIGFIGTGTIGEPMARQILRAGHRLAVHDLRREAAASLISEGAVWAQSPREVGERCRLVLTSLPGPPEVEQVVGGPNGLLAGARAGDTHVDLTTNSYAMARRVADLERQRGVRYLDSPVSGGRFFAEQGKLTVMVSGETIAFEAAKPALEAIGEKIFHLGEDVGTATLVKLANNAIFLASGLIFQELIVMVAKAGLDVDRVMEVLESSSAAVYTGLADMTLGRDFDNAFFTLRLANKDLSLALDSARDLGVDMPVTSAAQRLYEKANQMGLGEKVFFATLKALEEEAGTEVPKRKA